MSSYETLLENYAEDERLSHITFAEMSTMFDSLTEFVNEEVELTVEISLQEAEDGEVQEKDKKFGAAVKKTIRKLIEKLKAFITKIGEAVKAFVTKAKMVVKQGGNAALGKMLKKNGIKVTKKFTYKVVKEGTANSISKLYGNAASAASALDTAVKSVNINTTPVSVPEVPESVASVIEAFAKKFEDSSVIATKDYNPSDEPVSKVYADIVAPYLDEVKKGIDNVEKVCGGAQKQAKSLISELKKGENDNQKTVNADGIAKVSKLSTACMQLSAATVRFANSVLTIATKNAAKLALAAGASVPAAAKEKGGEVKADLKSKAQGVKANINAHKTGMAGKKAGAIQKQED